MNKSKRKRRIRIPPRAQRSLIYSGIIIGVILVSLLISLLVNTIIEAFQRNDCPHPYSKITKKYSEKFDVPEDLIYAVIRTESNFDPNATSNKGAKGLMQILPSSYEEFCKAEGEDYDVSLLCDPEINIKVGTYWLARMYRYYENWDTAIAAYNAGMGNVNLWLEDERYSDGDGILHTIPFAETATYVRRVNRYRSIYKALY